MLRNIFGLMAAFSLMSPTFANHTTITTTAASKTTSFPVTQGQSAHQLTAVPFILNDDVALDPLEAQFGPLHNHFVLYLAKAVPSAVPDSVGAVMVRARFLAASLNILPTQVGFDYLAPVTWIGPDDPRFNMTTTGGVFHSTVAPFFGTRTSSPNGQGW